MCYRSLLVVSAAALIDMDGRVLIASRPESREMSGFWEFPGGKVEKNETPELAIIRELDEELGINVAESCLAPFTFASHAYQSFHLLMPVFVIRRWEGFISPREGQELKWLRPKNMEDYPMLPANIPIVAMLRDFL